MSAVMWRNQVIHFPPRFRVFARGFFSGEPSAGSKIVSSAGWYVADKPIVPRIAHSVRNVGSFWFAGSGAMNRDFFLVFAETSGDVKEAAGPFCDRKFAEQAARDLSACSQGATLRVVRCRLTPVKQE